MNELETRERLRERSTFELVTFRDKLKKINTGRSWELRLFIIQEMLRRSHKRGFGDATQEEA
jgi:hypothetical protein